MIVNASWAHTLVYTFNNNKDIVTLFSADLLSMKCYNFPRIAGNEHDSNQTTTGLDIPSFETQPIVNMMSMT